jgi:non-ribosomal peptide synthetase component E (peptide arylation enzyme)
LAIVADIAAERGRREREAGCWTGSFVDGHVAAAAELNPAGLAIVDGAVRLSYAELDASIDAAAGALAGLGVGKGDAVSWQLPNWHEAVILHHAVLRIGAVSNPIVPIYRQREVEYILAEAGSAVVVVPHIFRGFDYAAMIDELRPRLAALKHVVVVRPEARAGDLTFEQLLASDARVDGIERSPDDAILLMFTSGTTARPKGVVHTHNTLDYENRSIIDIYQLREDDRVFMPSPVTHVTGMLYGLQMPAMLRTAVVLQDVWEPLEALELMAAERCTFSVAATPFLHALTYHPRLDEFDLSALRVFGCGGADVPPALIRAARQRLDCFVTRVYGSTEFPTLSTSGPDDPPDKAADTDGRAIAAATYRIVDESLADVAIGEVGELLVKGPEALAGYQRPRDGLEAFTPDGWFRTGDLAAGDADGYLTIRGRRKDIILRGGENISVKEVEDLLFEHPLVGEIAIVAMPDPVMVERACAFVVPSSGGEPSIADFADFLSAAGVAKQKFPERIEIVTELPKTQSGKVQKYVLRDEVRAMLRAESEAGPEGRRLS